MSFESQFEQPTQITGDGSDKRQILSAVYSDCATYFWSYYKLALPPSLFALLVYWIRSVIVSRVWELRTQSFALYATVSLVANFALFGLVWTFETFAFAAISDSIAKRLGGTDNFLHDGYAPVRDRTGSLIYVSLATYTPFIVVFLLLTFIVEAVIFKFQFIPPAFLGAWWFEYVQGHCYVYPRRGSHHGIRLRGSDRYGHGSDCWGSSAQQLAVNR